MGTNEFIRFEAPLVRSDFKGTDKEILTPVRLR